MKLWVTSQHHHNHLPETINVPTWLKELVDLLPVLKFAVNKKLRESKCRRKGTTTSSPKDQATFHMFRGSDVDWEEVLEELTISPFLGLTQDYVKMLGQRIVREGVLDGDDMLGLANASMRSTWNAELIAREVAAHLPVVVITFRQKVLLADAAKLIHGGGEWFACMVSPFIGASTLDDAAHAKANCMAEIELLAETQVGKTTGARVRAERKKTGGCVRMDIKWPQMVNEALLFIKTNSFAAQDR
jgi:hypothetical protein